MKFNKEGLLLFYFIAITNLPNYFKEIFGLSSTSQFFIFFIILFNIILFKKNVLFNINIFITLFILFIFYTILLLFKSNVNLKVDWIKYITFFIFLFLMLLNAKFISSFLFTITSEQFINIINIIIYIFAAGAFFALLGYSAFGKIIERKPVLFFSEPSHFAIAISPFLLTFMKISNSKFKNILIIFFVLFAIFYKSVTLIIVFLFYNLFFKKIINIKSLTLFLFLIILFLSNEYFLNRIPGRSDEATESLSYLQGIEQIYETFKDGYYFGVGPQQMGINLPKGEITDLMYMTTNGVYLNQFDGSIGFSKLLVEFGIIGFIFCIYLLYKVIKYRKLFAIDNINTQYIFLYSSLVSILMYLFVRGGGYLNATYLFIFVFLYNLKKLDSIEDFSKI